MDTVRQSRRLGIIGSVVGVLALLASALTHLLPAAYLADFPGQAKEEAAPKDRDHRIFRIKQFEIRTGEAASRQASEPHPSGTSWNDILSTAAVALALLAITLAVFAVILREEKMLAGVAAALGVAAIAVQVWWALVIVAVAVVILNGIVS